MTDHGYRVILLTRWVQYVHYFFPGLRLSRSAEDVCDACVTVDIKLMSSELTDERRVGFVLHKSMHFDAAWSQRHMMNEFVQSFVHQHNPEQPIFSPLPEEIEEDHLVVVHDPKKLHVIIPKVTVQAQDFGGSLTMPHYGYRHPSADFYKSNLIVQNFVIADKTNGTNNIYFYDQRAQGKDGNAFCSLRMAYHLTKSESTTMSLDFLDNCVVQNKSNSTMSFCAMPSLLFYKKLFVCVDNIEKS